MSAEKRTVKSEIREFFAEVQDGWRGWRTRAGAQRPLPNRVERAPSNAGLAISMDAYETNETDETDEITFTPLELEADRTAVAPQASKSAGGPLLTSSVCPVTRQIINSNGAVYQCRLCGIYYSPEGWEFLRQTAKGQCCGCRNVKTVLPVVRVR